MKCVEFILKNFAISVRQTEGICLTLFLFMIMFKITSYKLSLYLQDPLVLNH